MLRPAEAHPRAILRQAQHGAAQQPAKEISYTNYTTSIVTDAGLALHFF